jgi:nicotinate-nucleotide adenylyltransferase
MMRIGLFGGTFNPIHRGHLGVARDVLDGFRLDEIIFIPAALPPHKAPGWVADAEDRLAMLQIALADTPRFQTSDVELRREGPSYTIDTVKFFKAHYGTQEAIYLIVGLDAFLEIDTWKSFRGLFNALPMIVMSRSDDGGSNAGEYRQKIELYLTSNISNGYRYSSDQQGFVHPVHQPVFPFAVTPIAISATQVRDHIRNNRPVQQLVPEKVAAYIKQRGLYR